MKKWYVSFLALLFLAVSLPVQAAQQREKVILDTDMVEMFDDGVALVMLANAPNVELLGVTCLTGNSWVEEGVAYAIRHLEIEGKGNIPVAIGFDYPLRPGRHANFELERASYGMGHDAWLGSLGREKPVSWQAFYERQYARKPTLQPVNKHAVQFIIDTVRANPGEVTIAAIGPCTNLAVAVRMAPDIVPLIKRVIYMGGAFYQQGNTSPTAEFNWWIDPEAAQIAVRTPFKSQTIFGLDVCEKVVFRREHYDRFMKTIESSGAADIMRKTYVGQMFSDPEQNPNFTHYVWDVLVAAAIIDPSVVTEQREAFVDVNTSFGPSYGQSVAFPQKAPAGTQKMTIIMDVDQTKFWNMLNDTTYWSLGSKQGQQNSQNKK